MPYFPGKPPPTTTDDGAALAFYLEDELSRLASSILDDVQSVEIRPAHAAPLRPRAGMMVYADGTDWNPGFGEGLYSYTIAGTWVKLVKTASATTTNEGVDLGSTSVAVTPYIDFHSSGNNIDYDSRIIASGGSATPGAGGLTISASLLALSGDLTWAGVAGTAVSPALACTAGAYANAGCTAVYKQFGKYVFIRGVISIVAIGTATGYPVITMPVTGAGFIQILPAEEVSVNGFSHMLRVNGAAGQMIKYDANPPLTAGSNIYFTGMYEAA